MTKRKGGIVDNNTPSRAWVRNFSKSIGTVGCSPMTMDWQHACALNKRDVASWFRVMETDHQLHLVQRELFFGLDETMVSDGPGNIKVLASPTMKAIKKVLLAPHTLLPFILRSDSREPRPSHYAHHPRLR